MSYAVEDGRRRSGQERVERISLLSDAGETIERRSRGSDAENNRENSFLKQDGMAKKSGPALSLYASHFAERLRFFPVEYGVFSYRGMVQVRSKYANVRYVTETFL